MVTRAGAAPGGLVTRTTGVVDMVAMAAAACIEGDEIGAPRRRGAARLRA